MEGIKVGRSRERRRRRGRGGRKTHHEGKEDGDLMNRFDDIEEDKAQHLDDRE